MRLLRQRWRLHALNSCLGIMDIKTGAIIVVLFALLNKVAGIYGLIAIFNGGTLAQLSMYIYSVLALAAFTWGMNAITEENPKKSFYFAHIFLGDHLLNTIWTVLLRYFVVVLQSSRWQTSRKFSRSRRNDGVWRSYNDR
ncbi:hypothetical protein BS47DRAFT_249665 [Hydnum rufescens UP504]|uniref:Uncharacterized protein n=1 Tax=Hydnum rufescens UP504 TaxID=1448309 RepID=A0A9P6DS17_9AGAM|nr:hypothetical protein BS47DRAFT_249665 [Hydnum rufescens UP504]